MDRGAILSNCHIIYETAVNPIYPQMLCGPNSNPVLSSFRTWRIEFILSLSLYYFSAALLELFSIGGSPADF